MNTGKLHRTKAARQVHEHPGRKTMETGTAGGPQLGQSDDGVLLRSPDGLVLIEASGSLVEAFLASGWQVVSEYRR
jgi:hypothetical protein